MSFKSSDRMQTNLFPATIDDYVSAEDPVRVYDAFVEALDFQEFGIPLLPQGSAEQYNPKDLLKLLIYGYSYGIRSSRKLERASHHNLSFIWLLGDLKPDYRTIARFRREYKAAIKKVLKQCVRICMQLDLIEGNTLFIDGSVFRANASKKKTKNKEKIKEYLTKIETHIDELLEECERVDLKEDQDASLVKLKRQIQDKEQFVKKLKTALHELESEEKTSINLTDKDAMMMRSPQGTHLGYNAQIVVDEKHGLIVQSEATTQSTDLHQMSSQVRQAQENTCKKAEIICADAGYHAIEDLKTIDPSTTVVVPSKKHAQEKNKTKKENPFAKEHFHYDADTDCYICPEGHRLTKIGNKPARRNNRHFAYKANAKECQSCCLWGLCTSSPYGRTINRSVDEKLTEKLASVYESPKGQQIYPLRQQRVEHPFGHFKRNMAASHLLLRSRPGADAELSIFSTCFNIARMITIIGIPQLILKLKGG